MGENPHLNHLQAHLAAFRNSPEPVSPQALLLPVQKDMSAFQPGFLLSHPRWGTMSTRGWVWSVLWNWRVRRSSHEFMGCDGNAVLLKIKYFQVKIAEVISLFFGLICVFSGVGLFLSFFAVSSCFFFCLSFPDPAKASSTSPVSGIGSGSPCSQVCVPGLSGSGLFVVPLR